MQRSWSTAVATLLCVALLAAACGNDGGGDETGSASTIDDVLGTQAVQDFAIHLGMWVLVDDDSLVDFYGPLLGAVSADASVETALNGGMVFAPIEDLDGRVVDADRIEMGSVSVDFGVLRPNSAEDSAIDEELTRAADASGDDELIAAVRSEGEPSVPLLVEIVTASYDEARIHVGPGDRSEIDVTFLDEVEPGDRAIMTYLFGQTLPGDPAVEGSLSPHELFVYRWNAGLVQVYGKDGVAEPLVDTEIALLDGSTILTRDQKRELAQGAGLAAGFDNFVPGGIVTNTLDELWLNEQRTSTPEGEIAISGAEMPLPLTDKTARIVYEKSPETSSHLAFEGYSVYVDGQYLGSWPDKGSLRSALKLLRVMTACVVTATLLRAQNEAGRRVESPFARFPTSRPSESAPSTTAPLEPEDPPEDSDDSDPPEDSDDSDPPEDSDESDPPPLGCEPPPEPGLGGAAFGDVRITTPDGVAYGQQAPGEFLLYENATTTVQMRAEPAGDSDNLTLATAFAVATGGDSIAMHAGGRTFVNGEQRELERGERIRVGEAEVLWGYLDGWTFVWPDGQVVKVFDRGPGNGMSFTIEPVTGSSIGQLGDTDGNPENDFVTRDGTLLDASVVDDHETFYGTFVESWRLTQEESHFHYEEGESTDSFTIDGFPSTGFGIGDLGPAAFEEAAAICEAASIDDTLFEGCVVDVAATGDPGYAYDTFRVQMVTTPRGAEPAASDPPPSTPAGEPGDTLLTIAGETLVFGADPPNQRPLGIQASWNCEIIDGNLFADGSIDLADGPRYSITVQYIAEAPRLTLLLETPNEDGLTTPYAWIASEAAHFAGAIETMTLDGQQFTVRGELYVNASLERGLAPSSLLPEGSTYDPFSLDLDCVS